MAIEHSSSTRLQDRFPRHPGLFFLTAALAVLGLISTYLYFVRTTTGQYIDESALVEAPAAQRWVGKETAQFLDILPASSVVIGGVVLFLVTVFRRRWLAALIAVVAMVGANVSTQMLKAALPDRPDRGVSTLDFNSLPSGHTTVAASAAVAVFLVVSPRWRPLAAFAGASYAIFSGFSLLINQWHRPADVLAAFLMVAAWAALAGWAILRTGKKWNQETAIDRRRGLAALWPALSVLLGLAATALAVYELRQLDIPGAVSTSNYFLAGTALIVVAGYLISVAGVLLFSLETRRRAVR